MEKSYYEIREGLLSLLCVGSPIFTIYSSPSDNHYSGRGKYNYTLNYNNSHYVILRHQVSEIINKDFIKINLGSTQYCQSVDFIFAYEGELYVWNADHLSSHTHEERAEIVINLLKSRNYG
jgi:hypothetical protein